MNTSESSTDQTPHGRIQHHAKPRFLEVPYTELLEPLLAARESLDEDKLGELIESIRDLGYIIEPLIVEEENGKYRVHAGHRRCIAAQALQLAAVPVLAYPAGQVDGEAVKSHENAFREDLNAAEEAKYFQTLLTTRCSNDVDQLCRMVRQKRGYVEGRLLLIQGDPRVFEKLAAGKIGIGVAAELNKITNEGRRMVYLDAAAKAGSSTALVRQWRIDGNRQDAEFPPSGPIEFPTSERMIPASPLELKCVICNQSGDTHEMEILYAHRSCQRVAIRQAEQREALNNGG